MGDVARKGYNCVALEPILGKICVAYAPEEKNAEKMPAPVQVPASAGQTLSYQVAATPAKALVKTCLHANLFMKIFGLCAETEKPAQASQAVAKKEETDTSTVAKNEEKKDAQQKGSGKTFWQILGESSMAIKKYR